MSQVSRCKSSHSQQAELDGNHKVKTSLTLRVAATGVGGCWGQRLNSPVLGKYPGSPLANSFTPRRWKLLVPCISSPPWSLLQEAGGVRNNRLMSHCWPRSEILEWRQPPWRGREFMEPIMWSNSLDVGAWNKSLCRIMQVLFDTQAPGWSPDGLS